MAIDTGFARATESILDANITTLIYAFILFLFAGGGGPVKGFALCLMIGVCASVFSALFITRALVVWWFNATRAKLPITTSRLRQRIAQHLEIIEAIAAGDPETAARAAIEHVRGAGEDLLRLMQQARMIGAREARLTESVAR